MSRKNLKLKIGCALVVLSMLMAGCNAGNAATAVNLNALTLDEIEEKAREEGRVDSTSMPDDWANLGETWALLKAEYNIAHTDVDLTSAEEIAIFETEGQNATKDMGNVGQAFGPIAVEKGLTLPYKTSYWDEIPDWAKDTDGHWITAYYGTIAIFVNTNLVANPPTSFADIAAGDYMVSIGDLARGAQAQYALLAAAIANGGSENNLEPGLAFFREIAQAGRLDKGQLSVARMEKGEVEVALLWDFNALNYRDAFMANNPNANFEVNIPSDGSIQAGYCTIINRYAKHPHASALMREYMLSDEGQINLARGYARPIRSNVVLPQDVQDILIPDEQYENARVMENYAAWDEVTKTIGVVWQEEVMAHAG